MSENKCICGISCRGKRHKDCKNGKFFYRCASLNVFDEKDYSEVLRFAQEYDFDKNRIGEPRVDFTYINNESRSVPCPTEIDEMEKREGKEAFLCRCYTRLSTENCTNPACKNKIRFSKDNEYEIVDYQVPPAQGHCGRVDLVLKHIRDPKLFLVEVKPARNDSPERLLRMICEILSYYYPLVDERSGYRDYVTYRTCGAYPSVTWTKFKKNRLKYPQNEDLAIIPAIAFFQGSPQEKEYQKHDSPIEALLQKYGIAVFCLSTSGEICLMKQY